MAIAMQTLIVGGNFGDTPKESKIIKQLADGFCCKTAINGGTLKDLTFAAELALQYNLIIWMPNVENDIEKIYPKKTKGSTLVVSKILRETNDEGDGVARIFRMHGNAVITIDKRGDRFLFKLIDALGNLWYQNQDIYDLAWAIMKLHKWTQASVRMPITHLPYNIPNLTPPDKLQPFLDLVKLVADKVENERGGRYFGNASTRCAKMFPSMTDNDYVYVSGRSTPKGSIQPSDMIVTRLMNNGVFYFGDEAKKPSVDTPIQLHLYEAWPRFNFMIHGHAYIENVFTLADYCPCGDMREFKSMNDHLKWRWANEHPNRRFNSLVINLKNHGFLIATNAIEEMSQIVNAYQVKYRPLCEAL